VPREALRGGPRPLSGDRSIRLLACRIDIRVDCERLAAHLDQLLPRAEQRYPISREHRLVVRRDGDVYRISEDGVERWEESDPLSAAYAVGARVHALALAAMPDFTKIHAGCASWDGRRFLAVGPPESGKTTLMARLAYEGFAVHGDELVLVKDGEALPYPRRFGVRAPTVALIPALAEGRVEHAGPLVTDPAQLGFQWVIDRRPIAAVFYLVPNHDAETRLEPCPKHVMAQRVMSQSTAPRTGAQQWIRDVCDMLDRAFSYTLQIGNLDEAVAILKEVLQLTPKPADRPPTETA
jgi:hypothetical protein